mmetsp:Transcript_8144/g.20404  ORF Transcript_8144/g.20404 Transcript_8144/m.20404 type:complete len:215 (-) Transcript_8144:383-1027(-)
MSPLSAKGPQKNMNPPFRKTRAHPAITSCVQSGGTYCSELIAKTHPTSAPKSVVQVSARDASTYRGPQRRLASTPLGLSTASSLVKWSTRSCNTMKRLCVVLPKPSVGCMYKCGKRFATTTAVSPHREFSSMIMEPRGKSARFAASKSRAAAICTSMSFLSRTCSRKPDVGDRHAADVGRLPNTSTCTRRVLCFTPRSGSGSSNLPVGSKPPYW